MKTTQSLRRVLTSVLAAGVALLAVLVAPVSPASAATVERLTIRGDAMSAYGYSSDGCSETYESVSVSRTRSEVTVYYSTFGYVCGGEFFDHFGSGMPTTFDFTRNLSHASVAVDLVLYDYWTGDEVGTKALNLIWTAAAAPVRSVYEYKFGTPGRYMETYRARGRIAEAGVTGSFEGSGTIGTSVTGYRIFSR